MCVQKLLDYKHVKQETEEHVEHKSYVNDWLASKMYIRVCVRAYYQSTM